jgi:hypothetical protein
VAGVSSPSFEVTETPEGLFVGGPAGRRRPGATPLVLVGAVYAGLALFVGRRLSVDMIFALMFPGLFIAGFGAYIMCAPRTGILATRDEIRVRGILGEDRVTRQDIRAYAMQPAPPPNQAPILELYGAGTLLYRYDMVAAFEPAIRELIGRLGIPEAPAAADHAPLPIASAAATAAGASATYRAPKRLTFVRLLAPAMLLIVVAIGILAATPLSGLGFVLIWGMIPWAMVLRGRWATEIKERLLVKVTAEQLRVRSFGYDIRLSRAEVAGFHIDDLPPRLVLYQADGSVAAAATLADRVECDALRCTLREGSVTEV